MHTDLYIQRQEMDNRMIGIIGAFDENGVYGIGDHLPWGNAQGMSHLKLHMGRFKLITKEKVPEGEQNVLVLGRGTMEAMNWRPLPGRRTIVLSQTLDEKAMRVKTGDKPVWAARNVEQAIEQALAFPDCGHIYFGGGYEVWLQALKSGYCTHAFITVVMCDSVMQSEHRDGHVRRAREMLNHETYPGMECEPIPIEDKWGENPVMLEFRNYQKV